MNFSDVFMCSGTSITTDQPNTNYFKREMYVSTIYLSMFTVSL